MSGNPRICLTRAEFVQKLTEEVKNGAKVVFFSPKTTQNWPKTHNPSQDLPGEQE